MLLLNFFPGFALFYFCMREDVDLYKGKNAKICEMYQYVIDIRKNEISLLWIDIHFVNVIKYTMIHRNSIK